MKSSHIPKKGSVLYVPVRLLEKFSSSANDLWDDYFGGGGGRLPYCTALRRVCCAACTRPDGVLRARDSRWSIQCGGSWIMAIYVVVDVHGWLFRSSGQIQLQVCLTICTHHICLISVISGFTIYHHIFTFTVEYIPLQFSSPPPRKKENEKEKKRKGNNHQLRLGTQMFPSLHKLNGFTSTRHLDML